ncbi:ligand-binding sensor domain-containing protein [Chryseosolibacter indicus]|uniref:Histidine kinase n=1 Tax=Chryseosolibacter indicus TaxID=2782351 RepID=A0ABS5VNX2_9BACT|nr:sensor histidine kinase [Chryseosolibacter indicus]MBT1701701.1 histidine kinase [Chryseosolibacter indicus]
MGLAAFKALSTLCLLVLIFRVSGQIHDIRFHHINVDDGLPSNTVNSVITDSRGFIWIASENGVSRFDGYSFTNFRAKESDSLTISSNITYVVFEDRQERLWLGSQNGLDLYNRNLDRFDKHFFSNFPVRAIYQDSRNNLWIGCDDGLYLYNEADGSFSKMYHEMFDTGGVVYNTIPSIIEDRNGKLWIGTSNGVCVLDTRKGTYKQYLHEPGKKGSLTENNVRKIVEDQKGRIWIATYGGGLNLFQPGSETFKVYKHEIRDDNSISTDLLPTLWADDDGTLWIGTDGKGIDIFNPDTEIFHHVIHSPYNSRSLNNNVIRSISSDKRGGVWVGTYNGGINFFNQNAEVFFHYRVPTINGNSSVTSFAEEPNGNIWIGTDGGGLSYFNRATGQFTNFYHDEKNKNSLSDNRIISLQIDENNELWIGTYLGGLCRYSPKTKKFTRYCKGDGSGISDNVIWALLIDSDKRVWAGTNEGLNLYHSKTNSFSSLNINNSNLSNNMVRCLFEDDKKRLWVGTQRGLNILEKGHAHFAVITSDNTKEDNLSNDWIRTIHSDRNKNIWIGTFAGGINLYDEMTKSFLSLGEKNGLPDNMVSAIQADESNNLWISTGRGLAYLDTKNRTFRNYNTIGGLQDYQYNINASYVTNRGEFLFGGNNGFTLFVPEVIKGIKSNKYPPRVAITSMRIFNREVNAGEARSPLTKQINETENIVLDYDQNVITFDFSALNFIQPERNQYAYKLAGFEKDWNFIDNKRSATYTNLEPGSYTFSVMASNNDGIWNEEGRNLKIKILPPFWGTWWFKTLMAVVCMITALVVLNIVRNRIKEKIRINKIIAELELKALIAQMNPHFIFNCLTSIQELIAVQRQDEAMHYLNQFSRLLRTVLQSSEKNYILLDEEITLLELYLELESMRFDKQFHYQFIVDESIETEDVIVPTFLLQPFIENALWHGLMNKSGERNLVVSFMLDKDQALICKVRDNGIGREQAAKNKRNSIKYYPSMGIKIIRDRITVLKQQNDGFDLKIIDETDPSGDAAGTTVVVRIPRDLGEARDRERTDFTNDALQVTVKRATA